MSNNVFAYTAPGLAPEFISVNIAEHGSVEILIRSPGRDGVCKDVSSIKLSAESFAEFARTIYSFACTNAA